jgi:hypothetical protein
MSTFSFYNKYSFNNKFSHRFLSLIRFRIYFSFRMEDRDGKKPFIIPKTHTTTKGIIKLSKANILLIIY